MTTTTTTLTKADVARAMEDERRLGTVGYSECVWIGVSQRLRSTGDGIVVRTANAKGWTYEDLVIWVDSKYGRWFWDALYGGGNTASAREDAARCVDLDWYSRHERDIEYGI